MGHFGFDGKQPEPCSNRALELADAICEVSLAKKALEKAMGRVPNYTAQWDPEDYYADEQERYFRAAEILERMVDETT